MKKLFNVKQRDKNIMYGFVAVILVATSLSLFFIVNMHESVSEKTETAIQSIETPQIIRSRYSSDEAYLHALEALLLDSVKFEHSQSQSYQEQVLILAELLIVRGALQLLFLAWPIRRRT